MSSTKLCLGLYVLGMIGFLIAAIVKHPANLLGVLGCGVLAFIYFILYCDEREPPHQHHHEMQFINGTLNWIFICKCGHTTTDIYEACP